jgi:hypothetical protein
MGKISDDKSESWAHFGNVNLGESINQKLTWKKSWSRVWIGF